MSAIPTAALDRKQSITLTAAPSAASEARVWLTAAANGFLDRPRTADLELVISEVVTNAIRHGEPGGEILLAVTPKAEFLCVQVTDAGPGLVPEPGAMGSEPHGGFGLFIVEQLTRRWGITRERRRTRVWFEFDYALPEAT